MSRCVEKVVIRRWGKRTFRGNWDYRWQGGNILQRWRGSDDNVSSSHIL